MRGETMVRRIEVDGGSAYICEICGLGYADEETARECEKFCSTHGACSLEITRRAVYFPKRF
jgi:hypothetical protein